MKSGHLVTVNLIWIGFGLFALLAVLLFKMLLTVKEIEVDEDLFEVKKGEAETLAGFILEISGNFPSKGQKISYENCLFTIETVDKKRIKQIKVTIDA